MCCCSTRIQDREINPYEIISYGTFNVFVFMKNLYKSLHSDVFQLKPKTV